MGITTRVPRLLSTNGYDEWKYRFERFMKMKDSKGQRSIMRGPTMVTYKLDDAKRTMAHKPEELFTDEDFAMVEDDERAFYTLTLALSPDIAIGLRDAKLAKELLAAIIDTFKGNKDMQ